MIPCSPPFRQPALGCFVYGHAHQPLGIHSKIRFRFTSIASSCNFATSDNHAICRTQECLECCKPLNFGLCEAVLLAFQNCPWAVHVSLAMRGIGNSICVTLVANYCWAEVRQHCSLHLRYDGSQVPRVSGRPLLVGSVVLHTFYRPQPLESLCLVPRLSPCFLLS